MNGKVESVSKKKKKKKIDIKKSQMEIQEKNTVTEILKTQLNGLSNKWR